MAELTAEITPEVEGVCRSGAPEAAAALTRALGADVSVSIGSSGIVDLHSLPQWMGGPGLVVVLTVGGIAALVLIPEESGIIPDWCAEPDPTGQSKLATLAQELGMALLPEQYFPEDFRAGHVKSLHGAAVRGGLSSGAALMPLHLELDSGGRSTGALVWPASRPSMVLGATTPKPKSETKCQPKSQAAAATDAPPSKQRAAEKIGGEPNSLPLYTRSLLKIKVPVVVTLAEKRQALARVVELSPGSIIQFDKSCEELLELNVGGRQVAMGEAVKVGDKFGLRIKSVLLPEERFGPIRK